MSGRSLEQRAVAATWGVVDWERIKRDSAAKRKGAARIVLADWSHNGRTVHVGLAPDNLTTQRIRFTDGTWLELRVIARTADQVIAEKIEKKDGYGRLIAEAARSGQAEYRVTPG